MAASKAEPLGLKRGAVVLVPYDDRWPALFEEAAAELMRMLGPSVLAIHHVGSTAVPGLYHLSLAEPTSRHYEATLAFRDALRHDPRLRKEYAELKFELAKRFPCNRPACIGGKSEFVGRVVKAAGLGQPARASLLSGRAAKDRRRG